MGLFDRLNKQLGETGSDESMPSALDLADLPVPQRTIMRVMTREYELAHADLQQAISRLPEEQRLSGQDFDAAVEQLCTDRWLVRSGEETFTYRVNLRRKSGIASGVWSVLDKRIQGGPPPEGSDEG